MASGIPGGIHLIAPVMVQGGLNFKCVEALMAGRPVLTSRLGVRCLGDDVGVWGSDEAPLAAIRELNGRLDPVAYREAIRQAAYAKYSEQTGYHELDEWLDQRPTGSGLTQRRPDADAGPNYSK